MRAPASPQGQCEIMRYLVSFLLLIIQISSAYETRPTPWFCTDPNALDSTIEITRTLPSCLPGYVIDIEDVVYESTNDGSCSGSSLCSLHNKNTLTFACNRKRTCNVTIRDFRFHINATCGSTVRFFTKYRCLPVIQEQKDYLCEASTARRPSLGDINLSCERNYRLHITMALIGVNVKQQQHEEISRNRPKCNKDTYWLCTHYVPDAYRDVCNNRNDQCKIKYNERPALKGCPYGVSSNFSLVEYSCIPGEGVTEDLPRVDICSIDLSERIPIDRGLLHSPGYPHPLGKYLSCIKQLHIPRESRVRLFMLEKSMEYYHELNLRLLNNNNNEQKSNLRTLAMNEMFDMNLTTNQQKNQILQIELKTNHVGGGNFLLYFQVDSSISEYAPFVLEADRRNDRREKITVKRDWGIVIGCIAGLLFVLLLVAIVLACIRISRRRRARLIKYMHSDDDHRQHLNDTGSSPDHHHHHRHVKPLQIEHPHMASSPATLLPSNGNRPNSASSTTSSIIIHQLNDGLSDRESLLKRPDPQQQQQQNRVGATDIDNFYEEIKEQQNQAARALAGTTTPPNNHYLEPKSFEQRRKFFGDNVNVPGSSSSQPIRDHRENEPRHRRPAPLATPDQDKRRQLRPESATCDAPMASTETLDVGANSEQMKRPTQAPPKIPPQRMDLDHPKPSAPPLHLLQNDANNHDAIRAHQRLRHLQNFNNNNHNV